MNGNIRTEVRVATIVPLDDAEATLDLVGGKGASLARLAAAGLPVPDGFYVTTAAYKAFIAGNHLQDDILATVKVVDTSRPATLEEAARRIREMFAEGTIPQPVADDIVAAYATLPGANPAVAVRSSATAEDLPEASFAGQQETTLNVSGTEALLEATKKCWASLWTARAIAYRAHQGIAPEKVALAVVVQLMAPAEAAGIVFTAHPVTGQRDRIMISAAWGLGEAIVGGAVTPDTVVVDKESGCVISRETARKETMTVPYDGGTRDEAVPEHLRNAPVLDDEAVAALGRLGVQIEELYGMPMDIEWAWSGADFAILQARPITSLPPAAAETAGEVVLPDEWKLPDGAYMAMRNNIVELMADPLSPLFATMGLQAINSSLTRLLTTFFGRQGVVPEELIIVVNHYAYYNGSFSAAQLARILLGSVGVMRRMFSGPVARWTDAGRPRYVQTVQNWQSQPWCQLSPTEILAAARELTEAVIDAYGSLVSGVIPAAWISEALFTMAHKVLARGDDVPAPTYLMGFDSIPIRAEKSLYDLAQWARERETLTSYLERTPTPQLAAGLQNGHTSEPVANSDWSEWQSRFREHLEQYGHTIYNLDFASPVPADDPAPLLETCKYYLRGGGVDPRARQQVIATRRERATQRLLQRLGPVRRRIVRKFLAPAQRFAPLREDALAEVGLAYPLLRQMLLGLGHRLHDGGMIAAAEDIFWLRQDEVKAASVQLGQDSGLQWSDGVVRQRQAVWRAAGRLTPPLALMRLLGFNLKMRKRGRRRDTDSLKGVACSPGRVTATARVLRSPEDFAQMGPGEVLVASITTPAWTPLFAMASAIVTDVGGPLSHGSIVAREYGIPAVLGTGEATKRIQSGQMITVDGSDGVVMLSPSGRQEVERMKPPQLEGQQ